MRGENGRLIESDYRFNYVEKRVGVEVGGADMFFFYPRDNHLIRFPPFFPLLSSPPSDLHNPPVTSFCLPACCWQLPLTESDGGRWGGGGVGWQPPPPHPEPNSDLQSFFFSFCP